MASSDLYAWLKRLAPLAMLGIFGAALYALHHQLAAIHLHEVLAQFREISPLRLALAGALTVLGYLVLTGYDVLALRYVDRPLPYAAVATASFTAYAVGNNLGLAMLTGGSVRLRIYSAAGLSGLEVGQVIAICTFTFGLGVVAVLAGAFTLEAQAAATALRLPPAVPRLLGGVVLTGIAAYLAWNTLRLEPLMIRGVPFRVPGLPMTAAQIALAAADLAVAAAVLYVLLPAEVAMSYPAFMSLYVIAMVVAIASHVPGGIGVFEAVILSVIPTSPAVVGALLAYRVIYYLVPFGAATVLLAAHELSLHRHWLGRVTEQSMAVISGVAPRAVGTLVFVAGVVLLFSGSTPILGARAGALHAYAPLALIEISHLIASVVGLALLILARALFRRLDAAWYLSVALLGLGILGSILKGFDWEEALLLSGTLTVLAMSRREFYRSASLGRLQFTPGWTAAIVLVVTASIWLGLFSYKHVEYQDQLWWQFTLHGDAPRFMRASVLVVTLAMALGLWRALQARRPRLMLTGPAAIATARPVVAASPSSAAALALLGDKQLLFADSADAFIMFAVRGNSWIALGDPVGPEERWLDLLWDFRALVDRHGGRPAFYQVDSTHLPYYLDLGLTATKLGEEAHVALTGFSLKGSDRAGLRQTHRRALRAGLGFRIVPADGVAAQIAELAGVSDAWLAEKHTAEKGFSVGRFDPDYLQQMPCAVASMENRIVAFANIWAGGQRQELSIDLMRFLPDAPGSVMDYLLIETMLWGKAEGFARFNLGMAPLAGLEQHALAPIWHRFGSFVFRHGEHFYNFEGLREYKDKFDPEWRPRYLASGGGFQAARVLLDASVLIAGSVRGVLSRQERARRSES